MFSLFSVLENDKSLNHSECDFIAGLYDKYKNLMYATAQKYASNFSETEDIVQDSLIKLIKKQKIYKYWMVAYWQGTLSLLLETLRLII